jgi:hypothetical protein
MSKVRVKVGLEKKGHTQTERGREKRQAGKGQQKETWRPRARFGFLEDSCPGPMSKNEDILNGNVIKGVVVEVRLAA